MALVPAILNKKAIQGPGAGVKYSGERSSLPGELRPIIA
jgi:hypothetical protein